MSYAARIIERFGGTHAASKALSKPTSTVQSWKDTGRIPAQHQHEVLEKGQALDPPLSPSDFFDFAITDGEIAKRRSDPALSADKPRKPRVAV